MAWRGGVAVMNQSSIMSYGTNVISAAAWHGSIIAQQRGGVISAAAKRAAGKYHQR